MRSKIPVTLSSSPFVNPLSHHPFPFTQIPLNESLCFCPPDLPPLLLLFPSDPPTLSVPIRRLGPQWVCVLSSEVLYSPMRSHALQFRLALSILPLIPLNGNPSAGHVFRDCLSPMCVSPVCVQLMYCICIPLTFPFFYRRVTPPFCF